MERIKSAHKVGLEHALYDQRLNQATDVYIIDGIVLKNRNSYETNFSEQEIQAKKDNYENIGIQSGKKVIIYCDETRFDYLKNVIRDINYSQDRRLLKDKIIGSIDNKSYRKEGGVIIISKNRTMCVMI